MVVIDSDLAVAEQVVASLGSPSRVASIAALRFETRMERFFDLAEQSDLVVLTADDDHVDLAEAGLRSGAHVVSVSDDVDTVEGLRHLDSIAHEFDRTLVLGAGFSPGLSCLLTLHAGRGFDAIDEIHVAKFGTGGPACARQHHRALRNESLNWRDNQWETARGGSARELYWFPDPVGGLDCFQSAVPDPTLLHAAFPEASRVSARVAATRRDMSTKWLPMMRRPHPEGLIGAIRVEVRGQSGSSRKTTVLGALDRPAVAAGTVAAVAGNWAVQEKLQRTGAGGLAELVTDTPEFLKQLSVCGVKAAVFEGHSGH